MVRQKLQSRVRSRAIKDRSETTFAGDARCLRGVSASFLHNITSASSQCKQSKRKRKRSDSVL